MTAPPPRPVTEGLDLMALLDELCAVVPDRRPGGQGNEDAVELVAALLRDLGWPVECPRFPVLGWAGGPGTLRVGSRTWTVHPSPYAEGWHGTAEIRTAATEHDLDGDTVGTILLLHGELAAAPLTPKDYPFYGSERDARVVARLEASGALAVLAITGRAPEVAGSLDPFPLIEDGAFCVPTGNLGLGDGAEVLAAVGAGPGRPGVLDLPATRWASSARNVVARRGDQTDRVTVVAHLDSKPGTPGAIDNATGVVVLCRVAELLSQEPAGSGPCVELLAVNGEDCYAPSGELDYLASTDLADVRLAVNVDGVGLRGGPTAYSSYGVPDELDLRPLGSAPGLVAGDSWPQSDHMVFAAAGRPAVALTSHDFATVMHDIAHSPGDTPDLVDPALLDQCAAAIVALIRSLR